MGQATFEDKLITYGMYSHLLDALEHFNRLQVIYRNLVSVWLLAAFTGIGFILSSKGANMPFHPFMTLALICFATYVGVTLICYMDFVVSEKSIATLVHDAGALEKKHHWLPQIVHSCEKMNHLTGYINMKALFYAGCYLLVLLTFVVSGVLFILAKETHWIGYLVLIGVFLLFSLFSFSLLFGKKRKDPFSVIEERVNHRDG